MLSDRPSARANLIQEREVLRLQLKQLQSQTTAPSYVVEQAEMEQARLNVEQARDAIANFHADSPWTDYAHRVLPIAENTQLGELEAEYQETEGELAIAIFKLQDAQHQSAVKPDSFMQQAKILGKIQEINGKLSTVGVVRSPYSGQIKIVKWLGQTDQELQVELTITIAQSGHAFGE